MINPSAHITKKLNSLNELMLEHFINGFEVHFTQGKITYMRFVAIDPRFKSIVVFNAFRQALEKHFKTDGLVIQRVVATMHEGAIINYIHDDVVTSFAMEHTSISGHVLYDMKYSPGRYGDLERLLISTVHPMDIPVKSIDE
jgi:hypothetical protein